MNYLNLLIHPVKFFKQVAEKEKLSLLIPILILVVIGLISGVAAANLVSTMDLPTEQVGMVKTVTIITAIISGIVSLGVALVIKAGLFNLVLKKMGGEGSFKTAVYVIGLSYFPKIIQSILNVFFQKPIDMTKVSQMDWVSFLGGIFSVFNIWQVVLTIIGLAVVYGVSYKKTAIPVLGFEVVMAGLSLGITLFSLNSMAALTTTAVS
ncbi:MAG: YIP1 family protein [Acetobacterium woodii]|nr:YIP1 family protein [Acetobacterium woodii]